MNNVIQYGRNDMIDLYIKTTKKCQLVVRSTTVDDNKPWTCTHHPTFKHEKACPYLPCQLYQQCEVL